MPKKRIKFSSKAIISSTENTETNDSKYAWLIVLILLAIYFSFHFGIPIIEQLYYGDFYSDALSPFYNDFLSSSFFYLTIYHSSIFGRLLLILILSISFFFLLFYLETLLIKIYSDSLQQKLNYFLFGLIFLPSVIWMIYFFFAYPTSKAVFDLEKKQLQLHNYSGIVNLLPIPVLDSLINIEFTEIKSFEYLYMEHDRSSDKHYELVISVLTKNDLHYNLGEACITNRSPYSFFIETEQEGKLYANKTGADAVNFLSALIK